MVGALATDYILSQRKEQGRLPANGVVVENHRKHRNDYTHLQGIRRGGKIDVLYRV